METFIKTIGGRKFTFAILLAISAMGLFFSGAMTTEELKSFIQWIFTVFVAGNIAEKFSSKG